MYSIGALAALAGCKPVTVRYYERAGLLRKPSRRENGYRSYDERDLDDLVFIRRCRSHGFALEEIRKLLAMREAPDASCGAVDELVLRHITKLDGLLESIRQLRDQLAALRGKCPNAGKVSECGILRGLMDSSGPDDRGPREGGPDGCGGSRGGVFGLPGEPAACAGSADAGVSPPGSAPERGPGAKTDARASLPGGKGRRGSCGR
ncbi:MAG: MerR family transcriptional regulator [Deltaproteobacteria bacterium]|jgi:DNA-binding transcriptional MerR regulator|nr:MerR family transcriptional regulator [Deltaproteobacteria bacterium]